MPVKVLSIVSVLNVEALASSFFFQLSSIHVPISFHTIDAHHIKYINIHVHVHMELGQLSVTYFLKVG